MTDAQRRIREATERATEGMIRLAHAFRPPIRVEATAGPAIDCQVANCPIHPSLKAVSR